MPATAKRAGRRPKKGSRFLGQILGENMRSVRALRRLTQDDLAERMRQLGHANWVRATVSEVERYGRNVTVDELLGLALALNATIGALLEPTGVDGTSSGDLDIGLRRTVPSFLLAGLLVGGQPVVAWKGNRPAIATFEPVVEIADEKGTER